jgi:hypothetical protein
VDLNDKTYAKQFKAAAILQAIEAKQPNHPGIPHYIIHSPLHARASGLARCGRSRWA